MHEAVWCDTWIRYIYYSGSVVTNTYKLYIINQSINHECMSPLLEVILRTTDLHVSAKIRGHQYVHNSFKIINPSHPRSTSRPSSFHYSNIHFLVVLSLFMSSNLHFQFSCLLLIMSKMSSCPCHCLISSLLILSNLFTLWILLITLIWVAFSFAVALSDSTPHRHTTMRAPSWHWLQSVLCFYLAFCAYSRSCLQPFLQHLQFLPPLPSPSCMPSLLNIPPPIFHFLHLLNNLISDPHFTNYTLSHYLHHFGLFQVTSKSHLSITSLNACRLLRNPSSDSAIIPISSAKSSTPTSPVDTFSSLINSLLASPIVTLSTNTF